MNDMRDEFAKAALQGRLADPKVRPADWESWPAFCQWVADECYDLADAMLVAREKVVAKPEAPALGETLHYGQWRRGDELRVLVSEYPDLPEGTLVLHDDRTGDPAPYVTCGDIRLALRASHLEFVSRE